MSAPRRENDPKRTITPLITNTADRGGHVYPVKSMDDHLAAAMGAPATAASNRFKPAKLATGPKGK